MWKSEAKWKILHHPPVQCLVGGISEIPFVVVRTRKEILVQMCGKVGFVDHERQGALFHIFQTSGLNREKCGRPIFGARGSIRHATLHMARSSVRSEQMSPEVRPAP
jgi:hypothetical protein